MGRLRRGLKLVLPLAGVLQPRLCLLHLQLPLLQLQPQLLHRLPGLPLTLLLLLCRRLQSPHLCLCCRHPGCSLLPLLLRRRQLRCGLVGSPLR